MDIEKKKITVVGAISVGVTWIDGSVLFKREEKWSKAYYGICHFSEAVFAFAPIDYKKVTMITTIEVSPTVKYCDRAGSCVHFKCPMNRFKREDFYSMFKDAGGFSLAMPKDFGDKPLWFNEGEYIKKWKYFILPETGGVLMHKDNLENE